MKLDDFLKPKQVRCVNRDNHGYLTENKVYDVIGAMFGRLKIRNDNGDNIWYDMTCFELVLDQVETPLQKMELTSEFEALDKPQPGWSTAPDGFDWWSKDKDGTAYRFDDLPRKQGDCWGGPCNFEKTTLYLIDRPWHQSLERRPKVDAITATNDLDSRPMSTRTVSEPKFKVGDPVYRGLKPRIFKVFRLMTANVLEVELDDVVTAVNKDELCPATLENYEKLCSSFKGIDFEQPPKPLTGSDLCFEKLRNGKKLVMCAVSYLSDEKAIERNCIRIIKDCGPSPYHFVDVHGIRHGFAVPLNDETGEPLTESILND